MQSKTVKNLFNHSNLLIHLTLVVFISSFLMISMACVKEAKTSPISTTRTFEKSLQDSEPKEIIKDSKIKTHSQIRKIDFRNFTYTWTEEQMMDNSTFTLKNGVKKQTGDESGAELNKIEFGDVTNDDKEEAMISIAPETGGNCQCEMVYIYTLEKNKPKLLWSFDTWDGAVGGFKRAYAENGNLTLEIFGDNKFENGKWIFGIPEGRFKGYCCPTAFTKFQFKWNGEKFTLREKPKKFDYDRKNQK